jgi:hypothetical protein
VLAEGEGETEGDLEKVWEAEPLPLPPFALVGDDVTVVVALAPGDEVAVGVSAAAEAEDLVEGVGWADAVFVTRGLAVPLPAVPLEFAQGVAEGEFVDTASLKVPALLAVAGATERVGSNDIVGRSESLETALALAVGTSLVELGLLVAPSDALEVAVGASLVALGVDALLAVPILMEGVCKKVEEALELPPPAPPPLLPLAGAEAVEEGLARVEAVA